MNTEESRLSGTGQFSPSPCPLPVGRGEEGFVYLVGAGPGDAGLLTLRGAELLGQAEVVIYDGLVNRDLLRFAPASAELIFGGKHDRTRCVSQEELNALLLANARAGKRVVRLKGGDPYLFGRGGEEAELLAEAGFPFEVVPGVSSLYAVPGYAGIPLTHRDYSSSFTVVTGHEAPSSPANKVNWAQLAKTQGTLVVLMGLKNIGAISEILLAQGRPANTPVAVISRGSTAAQQTVTGTLETIADMVKEQEILPPAVTVIGEVVKLRKELNWFEGRPLFGRRIVVTQRSDLVRPLVRAFEERGAEVLQIPGTRWGPHPDQARLDQALSELNSYDWILFSNPLGIDFFFQRLLQVHGDLRKLGPARLGAYGPMSGEKLRQWHVQPAAVSADHKTPLILESITRCRNVQGQRFLLLRGEEALEEVPEALERMGAKVDVVPAYAVAPETEDPLGVCPIFLKEGANWITFASGMAIEHFHARFNLPGLMARFPNTRLAIASPTIQWALEKLGLQPAVVAKPNDVPSLVNGILMAEASRALFTAA